ncbi:MAG: MBG domain-containing protein, partial [Opitutaceae bacterium]
KADQTISFPAIADQLANASPFPVNAAASTSYALTFSVLSGPATIAGNVVTLTGAGSVTIRASQIGDANYNPASADRTFAVTKADATVTLAGLTQTYDGAAKPASATTAPGSLAVNLTYDGSTVAPTNAASYTVVATIVDARYQGAASALLTIAKSAQTIFFSPIGAVTVGTPVALGATASSGQPIAFSVVSGNATILGAAFTAQDANALTLRATQSGNSNYAAATADQLVTNIAKLSQTIAFAALADQPLNTPAFSLTATATSTRQVSFTVQSGPATVSGRMLTLTGLPGTVIVVAHQSGDAAYSPAPDLNRSFAVTAASTPTLVTPPDTAPAIGGTVTLTVNALGTNLAYQWQRNGRDLPGATATTLDLANLQPATAGLYTAAVTGTGGGTTAPVIVGVMTTAKTIGTATEVGPNLSHPNGNTYDQLLLTGPAAALTADAGQITRVSFVDLTGDIVQIEFSGAGTLAVTLDNATGPAPAANYNQPGVSYIQGHAGLVVSDADETTHLSVFSVGRITAVNQASSATTSPTTAWPTSPTSRSSAPPENSAACAPATQPTSPPKASPASTPPGFNLPAPSSSATSTPPTPRRRCSSSAPQATPASPAATCYNPTPAP